MSTIFTTVRILYWVFMKYVDKFIDNCYFFRSLAWKQSCCRLFLFKLTTNSLVKFILHNVMHKAPAKWDRWGNKHWATEDTTNKFDRKCEGVSEHLQTSLWRRKDSLKRINRRLEEVYRLMWVSVTNWLSFRI